MLIFLVAEIWVSLSSANSYSFRRDDLVSLDACGQQFEYSSFRFIYLVHDLGGVDGQLE